MRSIMTDMRYHVFWSAEDHEWVATVEQFPSLSFLHRDPAKALAGLIMIVGVEIDEMIREADTGGEG